MCLLLHSAVLERLLGRGKRLSLQRFLIHPFKGFIAFRCYFSLNVCNPTLQHSSVLYLIRVSSCQALCATMGQDCFRSLYSCAESQALRKPQRSTGILCLWPFRTANQFHTAVTVSLSFWDAYRVIAVRRITWYKEQHEAQQIIFFTFIICCCRYVRFLYNVFYLHLLIFFALLALKRQIYVFLNTWCKQMSTWDLLQYLWNPSQVHLSFAVVPSHRKGVYMCLCCICNYIYI